VLNKSLRLKRESIEKDGFNADFYEYLEKELLYFSKITFSRYKPDILHNLLYETIIALIPKSNIDITRKPNEQQID
jgi:hypothetical protein